MNDINPKLSKLEKNLGYEFEDINLLKKALTHRSKSNDNNERLEFLGDALLEAIISEILFNEKPEATEGELTRLRSTMVRGTTLAELGDELNIKDFIIVGSGELRTGGYQRKSTIADAFEAIIAAIFIDSNRFVVVKEIIGNIFAEKIKNLPDAESLKDSKTKLQEILQSSTDLKVKYTLIQSSGPDHNKTFKVQCKVDELTIIAEGKSKKMAEQNAAKEMLIKLKSKK